MVRVRKRMAALLCALALCFSMAPVLAETYSGYTTQNLNVRMAAGGEDQIVAKLGADVRVQVLDEETANGKSWLLISFDEDGETIQGYVISKGVERAVEMTVYSGTYSLEELSAGVFRQAEAGQTTGPLADSLKAGTGTYTWTNGAHYTGEWKEDRMDGKGTYYFGESEKNHYIKGQFSANAPMGTMEYVSQQGLHNNTTWSDGQCVSISAK